MLQERGYSLIELLVSVGLIGILSAITIPLVLESSRRNELFAASERVGALVRQTRLKAISQNRNYRVRFDCPSVNQVRGLVLTGTALVDNAANRCAITLTGDSEIVQLPTGVVVDAEDATELRVTPRGVFTAVGDSFNHHGGVWLSNSNPYGQCNRPAYVQQCVLTRTGSRWRKSWWRCSSASSA
jgi:prepilin-type N-terminal cleavage/methylation domain-containing protein